MPSSAKPMSIHSQVSGTTEVTTRLVLSSSEVACSQSLTSNMAIKSALAKTVLSRLRLSGWRLGKLSRLLMSKTGAPRVSARATRS